MLVLEKQYIYYYIEYVPLAAGRSPKAKAVYTKATKQKSPNPGSN